MRTEKVAVRLSSHRDVVDTIEGSNELTGIEAEARRTDAGIKMGRQWRQEGKVGSGTEVAR